MLDMLIFFESKIPNLLLARPVSEQLVPFNV